MEDIPLVPKVCIIYIDVIYLYFYVSKTTWFTWGFTIKFLECSQTAKIVTIIFLFPYLHTKSTWYEITGICGCNAMEYKFVKVFANALQTPKLPLVFLNYGLSVLQLHELNIMSQSAATVLLLISANLLLNYVYLLSLSPLLMSAGIFSLYCHSITVRITSQGGTQFRKNMVDYYSKNQLTSWGINFICMISQL